MPGLQIELKSYCLYTAEMQTFTKPMLTSIHSTLVTLSANFMLFFQVQIAEAEGLPVSDMVVYHQGSPVQDEVLCSSLADMSTLVVDARILGGNLLTISSVQKIEIHCFLVILKIRPCI